MRLLELFAGTGSVGKVAEQLGFEVISLDRDMPADINKDIMDWNYQVYEPKQFDLIWASPPCTEYSKAKTVGVRDIQGSNKVVQRTLDIIRSFEPKFWIIENPQTGLLKDQRMMIGISFQDVDYCKYGMLYQKRTRLWNNIWDWRSKPLCKGDCDSIREGSRRKHIAVAQRSPNNRDTGIRFKQSELYVVPAPLIEDIFEAILQTTF